LEVRVRAVALLLAVGCVASCGHTEAGAALNVDASQAGRTFHVHPGQIVRVTLNERFGVPGSSIRWSAQTSNGGVLSRTSTTEAKPTALTNVTYPIVIDFTAADSGRADIEATSHATCEAMNPAYCHGPPPLVFHFDVS
jgi:hypothetical protein